MIKLTAVSSKSKVDADLLVLPFYKDGKSTKPAFTFAIPDYAKPALASGDFSGNEGETLVVYSPAKKGKRIVLLGLGEKKNTDPEILRGSGASIAKLCRQKKWGAATIGFSNLYFAEGLMLAAYSFDALKGKPDEVGGRLEKVCFLGADKKFSKQLDKLSKVIEAINYTRDLINGNADDINTDRLVAEARTVAKEASLKITVLRKKELEDESLGLMLAVNRACPREPALVIIEYKGLPKSSETTALVGKGVVYDTGGLSLKSSGMETMKCDMSGAGTVLGILKAASALKLPVNLVGVLGIVENSIGPNGFKLGDVYKSRSGRTVEILSTDAEGRLVLADAISYLQDNFDVSRIIDLATLTGGAIVALGDEFGALFCNDDKLAKALIDSGEATGDRVWRMPLAKIYNDMIKSKIADIKNSSGRKGQACTAAAFIQTFVKEGIPWAHLDIAGPAYLDEPKGYHCSNATGFGIRLLLDYLDR